MKRRDFLDRCLGGVAGLSLVAASKKPQPWPQGKEEENSGVIVKVLGTAQDGGLPQFGCYCRNCRRARRDKGFSRLVASLAILDLREKKFFLLDATPDLRLQSDMAWERLGLEMRGRKNPPQAVCLTHAHIGHYTGLMFFGYEVMDAQKLPAYCSSRLANFLAENGPWSQLVRLGNIVLHVIAPDEELSLSAQVSLTPFLVPHRDEFSDTFGYYISGRKKKLLYIPDIQSWEAWKRPITEEVKKADIALLDGTFFSPDELPGRNLTQIGHPLIQTTLKILKNVAQEGKTSICFTHLNHTNLALDPQGKARWEVEEQGFKLAYEGMEFFL